MLILSRPIPVVSELVMLAAGMTRYPFWKYTLIISLTNAGIAIAFAGAGNAAIQHHTSFLLIASIGFPFLAWLAYQPLKKKA